MPTTTSEQPKKRGRPYPKRKLTEVIQAKPPKIESVSPWRNYQRAFIDDPNRLIFCVKGAQIGVSTASASWAVGECIARDNHLVIILSRSEPQAKELARKAKLIVDKLKGVESELGHNFFKGTENREHWIKFPNGSRIIALSSNPDTARGYTGDIILDEFAFHPQSDQIFKSAYRQITLGYRMRIISTPNGQQGKFYDMACKLGIADGIEPQGIKDARRTGTYFLREGWSLHYIDIHRAVADGFPVDPVEIRAGALDEDTWLQEYLCNFISAAQQWIGPELMDHPNVDQLVTQDLGDLGNNPPMHLRNLYAGWDVARHKDLSVVWFNEKVGDVTYCRGIFEMSKRPTPDQIEEARRFLRRQGTKDEPEPPVVQRMCIDVGSMGLTVYETLLKEFGSGQIEGVVFTLAHKEAMAVEIKRRMEEKRVRIPDLPVVRNSFRMIKKSTTATGQARFDAEHDEKFGHGDHFWAFGLAMAAESGSAMHPLFQYWQQQVEKQRGEQKQIAAPATVLPPGSVSEEQKVIEAVSVPPVLGDAQKKAAAEQGVFGAQKFGTEPRILEAARLAQQKAVVKAQKVCPQCSNVNLNVYLETMLCQKCGWKGPR
jgi:phage FluMu gp28-like protein